MLISLLLGTFLVFTIQYYGDCPVFPTILYGYSSLEKACKDRIPDGHTVDIRGLYGDDILSAGKYEKHK